jgi:AcrR family transcriptional regulator
MSTSQQPPAATRRRGTALNQAIYEATLTELADTSFEELSFDKIAIRAGTGKTSLYRRWTTPAQLVLAALTDPDAGLNPAAAPQTGSLRSDLIALLDEFAAVLDQPRGRALRPLLTQRPRHPELYTEVHRAIVEPRTAVLLAILEDSERTGDIRPEAATPRIAALGPHLIVAEHMESGTVDHTEVTAIVDEVLLPLVQPR